MKAAIECLIRGDVDGAIALYRQEAVANPADSKAHQNLGCALMEVARHDEALECFNRALELAPDDAQIASNRLYLLHFRPAFDGPALLREHQSYPQLSASIPAAKRSPGPLRIGYVSPHFNFHSQSPFVLPLLENHRAVDVYCYSDSRNNDAMTQRLQRCASWRPIAGKPDDAVAELIRSDRIDILVDLTMHMPHGRPLLFSRKPAPIQVAYLAYPGTTGLAAMDYRLTDPFLDSPAADGDYTERSIRLPQTFACFSLIGDYPEIPPPPFERNGFITFGCLNNFAKINADLLRLWSQVLHELPSSHLRLLAPAGAARQGVLQTLADLGVSSDRIDFVPRQQRPDYLREFANIDICLDTLPYNGHTTSLDGLWMGTPLITRVGQRAAGRVGVSLLSNLELPDLICHNDTAFIRAAANLAGDAALLGKVRRSLRERLAHSRIMNAPAFAREVEQAYLAMVENHCPA